MRILLVLLPILGCHATASHSVHRPPPGEAVSGTASADKLRKLQIAIGQADLLMDVLDLCNLAMREATGEEERDVLRVCTAERLRRRNGTTRSSR